MILLLLLMQPCASTRPGSSTAMSLRQRKQQNAFLLQHHNSSGNHSPKDAAMKLDGMNAWLEKLKSSKSKYKDGMCVETDNANKAKNATKSTNTTTEPIYGCKLDICKCGFWEECVDISDMIFWRDFNSGELKTRQVASRSFIAGRCR